MLDGLVKINHALRTPQFEVPRTAVRGHFIVVGGFDHALIMGHGTLGPAGLDRLAIVIIALEL